MVKNLRPLPNFCALEAIWGPFQDFSRFCLHFGVILDPSWTHFELIFDIFMVCGGCLIVGLLGCWFAGLLVVVGLLGCWVAGLLGCWVVGLLDNWFVGLLVCWFVGLLVCWCVGVLVCWFAGLLDP